MRYFFFTKGTQDIESAGSSRASPTGAHSRSISATVSLPSYPPAYASATTHSLPIPKLGKISTPTSKQQLQFKGISSSSPATGIDERPVPIESRPSTTSSSRTWTKISANGGTGSMSSSDSRTEKLIGEKFKGDAEMQEKLEKLMKKYDPKSEKEVKAIFPMSEHRMVMRTMFLDNILYATARLHRHCWVLGSRREVYRDLCTKERWDMIHEDLLRYTNAIKSYEYWRGCMIQQLELEPRQLPNEYNSYGRTLAIIDCASHHANGDPAILSLLAALEKRLMTSHAEWSASTANFRYRRETDLKQNHQRRHLFERIFMATFGGLTLIIPMLIMALDQRKKTAVITTSAFTLGIGLILAYWMDDAQSKDMIAATAAYAAVLVVFVGSATA